MKQISTATATSQIIVRIGNKKNSELKSYRVNREQAKLASEQWKRWRPVFVPKVGYINPDKIESIEKIPVQKIEKTLPGPEPNIEQQKKIAEKLKQLGQKMFGSDWEQKTKSRIAREKEERDIEIKKNYKKEKTPKFNPY